jgi:Holliday junction resolvase RusA-like endonuclease
MEESKQKIITTSISPKGLKKDTTKNNLDVYEQLPIRIMLPYPPSLDTLYPTVNGRRILSKKGKDYKEEIGWIIRKELPGFRIVPKPHKLFCIMDLYPKDRRIRDIDNVEKIIYDSLSMIIYEDDVQIHTALQRKHPIGSDGSYLDRGSLALIIGLESTFEQYLIELDENFHFQGKLVRGVEPLTC